MNAAQSQLDGWGLNMSFTKPIGVAFLDQDIDGGIIGATNPQSIKGTVIYATQQLGYTNGSYGAATQLNNKTTGVTLNKTCGSITMSNSQLAPIAQAAFTLTNSAISANDTIIINIASGGTLYAYLIGITAVADGSCSINVKNVSNNAYSEALVINFAILHVQPA